MGSVIPVNTPADMIGGCDVDAMEREDAACDALYAGPDGQHIRALEEARFGWWIQDAWPYDGSNGYEFIASGATMERDGYRFVICGGVISNDRIEAASARLASGPMDARVKTVFTGTLGEVAEWAIAQVAPESGAA